MPPNRTSALDWLGKHDWALLVALLVVVAGVWAFAEVADEVGEGAEGQTQTFDEYLLDAWRVPVDVGDPDGPSRPAGPSWLVEVGRDLTALGGVAMLLILVSAVTGFLLLAGQRRTTIVILAATLGGLSISSLLKGLFDRPRPDVQQELAQVYTSSFPSGHSMMSAVVYLTLGTLLAELVAKKRQKFFCLSAALLVTGLVGVSRVYMGVHYPTDVLAGWSAGLAWATACWLAARGLRRWAKPGDQ